MAPGGIVHLKTDCRELHEYTLDVLAESGVSTEEATNDLYSSGKRFDEILGLKTFYEKMFLEINKPITYLKFNIDSAEVYRESHKPWKLDD